MAPNNKTYNQISYGGFGYLFINWQLQIKTYNYLMMNYMLL